MVGGEHAGVPADKICVRGVEAGVPTDSSRSAGWKFRFPVLGSGFGSPACRLWKVRAEMDHGRAGILYREHGVALARPYLSEMRAGQRIQGYVGRPPQETAAAAPGGRARPRPFRQGPILHGAPR